MPDTGLTIDLRTWAQITTATNGASSPRICQGNCRDCTGLRPLSPAFAQGGGVRRTQNPGVESGHAAERWDDRCWEIYHGAFFSDAGRDADRRGCGCLENHSEADPSLGTTWRLSDSSTAKAGSPPPVLPSARATICRGRNLSADDPPSPSRLVSTTESPDRGRVLAPIPAPHGPSLRTLGCSGHRLTEPFGRRCRSGRRGERGVPMVGCHTPGKFTPEVYTGRQNRWSGLRGSNPSNWLGKPGHYHYAKPAWPRS